ncbi:MAG: LppX_LprAFG lipoprotein [Chloroflexi bacterium]|nr:LppX_LprAFG lipoprotein [Chloroflexota bacterium]
MKRYAVLLMTLLAVVGAACGEQSELPSTAALTAASTAIPTPTATPEPTSTPPPTPTASPTPLPTATPQSPATILETASAVMEKLGSFHFDLEMEIKAGTGGISFDIPFTFVGDFQAPDRSKGTMSASILGFSIESEFVSIGETDYATNPETGDWEISPDELLPIGDPIALIALDASDVEDLKLLGEEILDGLAVYHLSGLTASGVFGHEEGGQSIKIDFWIGKEDSFVVQITASGEIDLGDDTDPLFADGTVTLSLTLKFSDFGKSVVIEAPEIEPLPTPAPVAVLTATPMPSPTPLPAGPLSAAVLTLDDFPAGFEEVSAAELGLGEGAALLDGLIIESSFAFANVDTFEFVFGFTLLIPTALEQIGFDLALSQPEFLLGSIASGIVEEGTEITEQVTLSDLDSFGEKSAGLSIAFNSEGIPFRMEMVAFRRETVGAFAAIMYFDGDTPIVTIDEAAGRFDDRIIEVLSVSAP